MTDSVTPSLLVLWDVDGTLIHNGGVSKEAYARGFELLTGSAPTEKVVTDGMTDQAIMRSLFERHQLILSDDLRAKLPEVMERALTSLKEELRQRGHAQPGAGPALEALADQRGVIQSVLTGNIAPNAYTKVSAFDLHHRIDFEVGGYGSDSEIRSELVAFAQAKAAAKYGGVFDATNTVLVGDTPRDIEAAKLGGASVIAVASGAFAADVLARLEPDVVLPSLRDTGNVVQAVMSFAGGGA
jgi:phosphoglycolate phosphatase